MFYAMKQLGILIKKKQHLTEMLLADLAAQCVSY
jgi:hypothetical protein